MRLDGHQLGAPFEHFRAERVCFLRPSDLAVGDAIQATPEPNATPTSTARRTACFAPLSGCREYRWAGAAHPPRNAPGILEIDRPLRAAGLARPCG